MREIKLKSGYAIIVDDEDYKSVIAFNWYVQNYPARPPKVFRWIDKSDGWHGKRIWLSKEILKCSEGARIKHKDNNPFNYCRSNLIEIKKEIQILKTKRIKKTKEEIKAYNVAWHKMKQQKDFQYKIRHLVRSRIWQALKRENRKKDKRTIELLGCSIDTFKKHLERQFDPLMTWENHGTYWHIDHIRPIASFDLTDSKQLHECFHYTNCQPLEASENIRKKDKIDWVPARLCA